MGTSISDPYIFRGFPDLIGDTINTLTSESGHYLAAVDLGSNSFHMKVVRVIDGKIERIDRIREMVRLASGLDEHNCLDQVTMDRALDCLSRFGERLREIPPHRVKVVGTNTLRKADNANVFIRLAEKVLGHSIEVIGGQEEARLVYLGVSHSVRRCDGQTLVIDIGGGSTELIIGQGYEPRYLESLFVGCVSQSIKYFSDGKMTAKRFRKAITDARLTLEPIEKAYRKSGWKMAVGSSGTIRTIGKVVMNHQWSDDGISADSLSLLQQAMIDCGDVGKLDLEGLSKDRAPVFPGGVATLVAVFQGLKLDRLWPSEGALREGLLYDMHGVKEHDLVRETTIAALTSRYQVDRHQVERVVGVCRSLYSQAESAWGLDEKNSYQECLMCAAQLHEVGLAVAHSQYHLHAEYIVRYSDLLGFTWSEQGMVAALIRAHRSKLDVDLFAELGDGLVTPMTRLAVILRVAVLLCRGRTNDMLEDVVFSVEGDAVRLQFPAQWLEQNALTLADLKREKKYLNAAGLSLKIASLY
ncbi:MAG TPA: exopolyphosphatase [Chromatiales bacterium]|nr:exopolyphosphatase [Chromatiaceae bacterium]HIN82878.1 exopolyphosphatase [Chromatiales bacterium]